MNKLKRVDLIKFPEKKEEELCGCVSGEGCGCEVYNYNQALADLRKLNEGEVDIREIIGETIGEASMQWSEIPTGIYESDDACELMERATQAIIKALTKEK